MKNKVEVGPRFFQPLAKISVELIFKTAKKRGVISRSTTLCTLCVIGQAQCEFHKSDAQPTGDMTCLYGHISRNKVVQLADALQDIPRSRTQARQAVTVA